MSRDHPIPNPVIDSDGKHYKKFDDVWKKEVSKKPLQLPQGSIKSVDPSKKPRIVYFQYKPSGNGLRTLRQHFVALQEGDDFQCGDDTSHLFKDDSNLKSKNITTDKRSTCGSPV